MKLKMFAIHDAKSEAFAAPFCFENRALAIREFGALVNDKDSKVGKWPHDFTLFQIAEYDTDNGGVIPLFESLGNGVEYVIQEIKE